MIFMHFYDPKLLHEGLYNHADVSKKSCVAKKKVNEFIMKVNDELIMSFAFFRWNSHVDTI